MAIATHRPRRGRRLFTALLSVAVVAAGLQAFAAAPQSAQADLTRDPADAIAPVVSYDFDGDTGTTVRDVSGAGNDGSWTGTPSYTAGVSGSAIAVSGGANYLKLPLVAGQTDAAASFSYEFWMKETSRSSYGPIISNQNFAHCYNAGTTLYNHTTEGQLEACWSQSSSTNAYAAGSGSTPFYPTTLTGQWHHIAAVFDRTANSATFYVDGVQRAQQTTKLTAASNLRSGLAFNIGGLSGSESDTSDGYVNADIDDVNFYNAAIPATQVAADFAATDPATHFAVTVSSGAQGTGAATPRAAEAGQTVQLSATPAAGYQLTGWQAVTPADLAIAADGSFTMPDSAVTVQPVFAANSYTVTFDANGGGGATAPLTLDYDQTAALPANGFARDGFQFIGWSTAPDGDVVYADGAQVSRLSAAAGGTVVLYAQWAPAGDFSVTVSGDAQVTLAPAPSDAWLAPGTEVSLHPSFTAGYTLDSWAVTPSDLPISADGTFTMPAANVTVQAHSAPISYTVRFDGNGADGGATAAQTLGYGQTQALTANGFTDTDRLFAGWSTTPGGAVSYADGAAVSNLATTAGATVTLYARWTTPRAAGDTVAPLLSYDFDSDNGASVVDDTPNQLNGSWVGTAQYGPGLGGTGKAIQVQGAGGTVQLPLVAGKTDGSGSFSVVFWYGNVSFQGDAWIFSNNTGGSCDRAFNLYHNTDTAGGLIGCFGQTVGGAKKYQPLGTTDVTDAWHQVAGVVDRSANTLTWYLDGAQIAQSAAGDLTAATSFATGLPFTLGQNGNLSYGSNDTGWFDDLDFYGSAISAAQIQNDYAATKPASTALPTPVVPPVPLPEGFLTDDFSAAPVRVDGTVSQPLAGLWSGTAPTGWTKVSGDDWLQVSDAGVVTGTAPADAPQHPALITVEATNGSSTSRITLEVPVLAADDAAQIETATWNLWDAGSHVSDAIAKDLMAITQNGLTVIGLQEDGGTVATTLADALGWYSYEGADGLGIVSAWPIAADGVVPATDTSPAAGVTVDVAGQSVRVWVAGLDGGDYGPYQACFDGVTDPAALVSHEQGTDRYAQAQAVAAAVAADAHNAQQTPMILLGDLESPSGSDWTAGTAADHCGVGPVAWPVPAALAATGLTDSFRQANPDPAAADGDTWSPITPTNADGQPEPQDRVDYVWYAGDALSVVDSNTMVTGWPSATAPADNSWTSDHRAVVTVFTVGDGGTGPTPVTPVVSVAHGALVYQAGNGPADDAALLQAIGATSDPADAALAVDRGDTDFTVPGSYTVLVTATLDGFTSDAVAVTVRVVPVVTLSLLVDEVTFPADTALSSDEVLAALGASATASATITVDLAGVDVNTPGSYPVTVTASDADSFTDTATATVVIAAPTATAYPVTVTAAHGSGSADPSPAVAGTLVTLRQSAAAGYHFAGWQAGTPADLVIAADGTFTMPAGPVAVTAAFTPNSYTVVYDGNGATAGATPQTSFSYDAQGALAVNGYSRTGYDFAGWATSADGDVAFTAGQTVANLTDADGGSITLYAVWAPTVYTIAYELAGGTVAVANPTVYTVVSDDITLMNPTRSGYSFSGWSGTGLTGTVPGVTIAAGSTGDRSYTAHWTAVTTPPPGGDQPLASQKAPAISGTVRVGLTVAVTPGTWKGIASVKAGYQWLLDGKAVGGATATRFTIPASAAGHALSVRETATATGHTTGTATSKTAKVAAGTLKTATPTLSGTVAVGKTVTAVPHTWIPAPSAFSYQWYANGRAISGARSAHYTISSALVGRTLTVKVAGTKTGYTTATATSRGVKVAAAVFRHSLGQARISGAVGVGRTVTAQRGTWSPAPTRFAYQWYADGKAIAKATKSTLVVPAAAAGRKLTVKVTASRTGYTTVTIASPAVKVAFATFRHSLSQAKITGAAKAGARLTAQRGTWTPAPTKFAYQWYAGGTAVRGAVKSSYTVPASQAGKAITVRITASRTGYTTVTIASAAVRIPPQKR